MPLPKPIRNEADYDSALKAIDELMGVPVDTPKGDALEVLVTLVEDYEAKHWPVEAQNPISLCEQATKAETTSSRRARPGV